MANNSNKQAPAENKGASNAPSNTQEASDKGASPKMIEVTVSKKCYRDGKTIEAGGTCMVEKAIADKTKWMKAV